MDQQALDEWTADLIILLQSYAAVAACALLVLVALYVAEPLLRRRPFPLARLPPVRWTGHEVVLAFCVCWGLPDLIFITLLQMGFFQPLLGSEPPADNDLATTFYRFRGLSIISPLTLTACLAVLVAVLFARTKSRPHHYGLTWTRCRVNVALGLAAFIVTTPVLLGVHAGASLVTTGNPHLLKQLAEQHLEDWEWFFLAFQPLVMAPLIEEILFRGILQGWLRRATLIGHVILLSVSLYRAIPASFIVNAEGNYEFTPGPISFVGILTLGYGMAMYRMARHFDLAETEIHHWQLEERSPLSEEWARALAEERSRRWGQANAYLAMYGSSILFAAVHPWPTPIALFPMALVLGWLRWRSQSLLGPIVFHSLFNLVSTIVLYVTMFGGGQNGVAQAVAIRPSVAGSTISSVPASQLPLRK